VAKLSEVYKKGDTDEKLEILIGRLNHTCGILPLARFFMGPLHYLLKQGRNDFCTLKINRNIDAILAHW
jgi:hypothetical protein